MNSTKSNLFYPLVIVAGLLFLLTACAYCVMAARGFSSSADPSAGASSGEGLLVWLDEYGFSAMMIELGILAFTTVAAIATDELRRKRLPVAENEPNRAASPLDAQQERDEA